MTLIELLAAISILLILMAGMASAILMTTRAVAINAGSEYGTANSTGAVVQITADLQTALSFSQRTATALAFAVPDRNDDDQSENLRYAWSGLSSDPLTL